MLKLMNLTVTLAMYQAACKMQINISFWATVHLPLP